MKKKDKRADVPGGKRVEELCELLKGVGVAVVTAFLLLIFSAFLVSADFLKEQWMEGTVLLACVLAAVVGGGFVSIRIGKGSLLLGLTVGMTLALMLLTLGVLIYDADPAEGSGVKVMASCLCGGGIAGILFGKPKKKRRK